MELSRTELFRAMNSQDVRNVKELEGEAILPVGCHTHTYEDQEGKEHQVLVIKDGLTGQLIKTEVQAFIKKFMAYLEAFETLPDDDRPFMLIKATVSKKGNRYANFDVIDRDALPKSND